MPESTSSSTHPDPHLWVTILAGGSGTRFWPASTPSRPKQLLPLAGGQSLIKETLGRARGLAPDARIRVLAGEHLVAPFQGELGDLGPSSYLVEPEPRGTGPVLVWAAWAISKEDPHAVLLSLHADHAIEPVAAFHSLIRGGTELATSTDALFTIAVPPSRPETGFGYIEPGDPLPGNSPAEAFKVRSFVEKPDLETARRYMEEGYLWNSGIFLWRAGLFLDEVRRVAPELGGLIPLLEEGDVEGFFRKAPSISVDQAVLERSSRVASLRATFRWDDLGTWEALARIEKPDSEGNVVLGAVEARDSSENIVMAEEGSVVLFGVRGLAVVRSGDVVMVADRERTADLKELLETLPPNLKDPS